MHHHQAAAAAAAAAAYDLGGRRSHPGMMMHHLQQGPHTLHAQLDEHTAELERRLAAMQERLAFLEEIRSKDSIILSQYEMRIQQQDQLIHEMRAQLLAVRIPALVRAVPRALRPVRTVLLPSALHAVSLNAADGSDSPFPALSALLPDKDAAETHRSAAAPPDSDLDTTSPATSIADEIPAAPVAPKPAARAKAQPRKSASSSHTTASDGSAPMDVDPRGADQRRPASSFNVTGINMEGQRIRVDLSADKLTPWTSIVRRQRKDGGRMLKTADMAAINEAVGAFLAQSIPVERVVMCKLQASRDQGPVNPWERCDYAIPEALVDSFQTWFSSQLREGLLDSRLGQRRKSRTNDSPSVLTQALTSVESRRTLLTSPRSTGARSDPKREPPKRRSSQQRPSRGRKYVADDAESSPEPAADNEDHDSDAAEADNAPAFEAEDNQDDAQPAGVETESPEVMPDVPSSKWPAWTEVVRACYPQFRRTRKTYDQFASDFMSKNDPDNVVHHTISNANRGDLSVVAVPPYLQKQFMQAFVSEFEKGKWPYGRCQAVKLPMLRAEESDQSDEDGDRDDDGDGDGDGDGEGDGDDGDESQNVSSTSRTPRRAASAAASALVSTTRSASRSAQKKTPRRGERQARTQDAHDSVEQVEKLPERRSKRTQKPTPARRSSAARRRTPSRRIQSDAEERDGTDDDEKDETAEQETDDAREEAEDADAQDDSEVEAAEEEAEEEGQVEEDAQEEEEEEEEDSQEAPEEHAEEEAEEEAEDVEEEVEVRKSRSRPASRGGSSRARRGAVVTDSGEEDAGATETPRPRARSRSRANPPVAAAAPVEPEVPAAAAAASRAAAARPRASSTARGDRATNGVAAVSDDAGHVVSWRGVVAERVPGFFDDSANSSRGMATRIRAGLRSFAADHAVAQTLGDKLPLALVPQFVEWFKEHARRHFAAFDPDLASATADPMPLDVDAQAITAAFGRTARMRTQSPAPLAPPAASASQSRKRGRASNPPASKAARISRQRSMSPDIVDGNAPSSPTRLNTSPERSSRVRRRASIQDEPASRETPRGDDVTMTTNGDRAGDGSHGGAGAGVTASTASSAATAAATAVAGKMTSSKRASLNGRGAEEDRDSDIHASGNGDAEMPDASPGGSETAAAQSRSPVRRRGSQVSHSSQTRRASSPDRGVDRNSLALGHILDGDAVASQPDAQSLHTQQAAARSTFAVPSSASVAVHVPQRSSSRSPRPQPAQTPVQTQTAASATPASDVTAVATVAAAAAAGNARAPGVVAPPASASSSSMPEAAGATSDSTPQPTTPNQPYAIINGQVDPMTRYNHVLLSMMPNYNSRPKSRRIEMKRLVKAFLLNRMGDSFSTCVIFTDRADKSIVGVGGDAAGAIAAAAAGSDVLSASTSSGDKRVHHTYGIAKSIEQEFRAWAAVEMRRLFGDF
ncbi:hypothetical protein HK105_205259 [Polyrhizophydium stewartii]|uniref:Uncharacterized protein n=1 Tax=Polyrhizophydium stewartii TaxID=2732419 RepID=A0ABR4N6H5_9FUNG